MNANKLFRNVLFLLLLASILLVQISPTNAQAAGQIIPNSTAFETADMEATWDEFFEQAMQAFEVPGAIMVAVQGDEVLFSKGYGYADLQTKAPMDPQTTILRSGSIAKTLTATAVFQLAEQGKLNLDADINDYLTSFKIPNIFPEPVTARQLINMAGGFDTRWVGIRAGSLEEIIPLEEYLAERMPPRVQPPGRYRRYNDHEVAMAGYLVQVISGMPYQDYVRENIFESLEMMDSNIYLPDEQLSHAARGYPVGGGAGDAFPLYYYYLNDAPGAGFNTTAAVMAKYLTAHIQNGHYTRADGSSIRILEEDTALELQSNGFSHHPLLVGQANSFDEIFYNGQRYLRKFGGAPGMQNSLVLLPSEGMGFYLFTNSEGSGLRNRWTQTVVETYLSGGRSAMALANQAATGVTAIDPAGYAGIYRALSDETSQTTIVQVQALLNPDLWLEVQANSDGSLLVSGQHHTPVDSTLYRNTSSGGYTAFELDEAGEAKFLFQARFPYQKVSWIETPKVQLVVLGTSLLIFIVVLVITAVRIVRRRDGRMVLAGATSALNLLFLAGFGAVMLPVATGSDKWQSSLEPSLAMLSVLGIPLVASLLVAALLVKTLLDWRKGSSTPAVLLINTLALVGMAGFLFFLHTWNLLGWRF